MRDSNLILGLLASRTHRPRNDNGAVRQHLLLQRYSPWRVANGEMMGVADVQGTLGLNVIEVVPQHPDRRAA